MTGIAQITPRPSLQRHDGHFLAGFIEAEGCFEIRQNNGGVNWSCVFTLVQRDDDLDAFPLRGRKRRELAVWAAAARQLNRTVPAADLPQLAADLRALKRYVNPVGK